AAERQLAAQALEEVEFAWAYLGDEKVRLPDACPGLELRPGELPDPRLWRVPVDGPRPPTTRTLATPYHRQRFLEQPRQAIEINCLVRILLSLELELREASAAVGIDVTSATWKQVTQVTTEIWELAARRRGCSVAALRQSQLGGLSGRRRFVAQQRVLED